MAQANPLTLRPPPGQEPVWREAAERSGLSLHAWMRRHIEQGVQLELALEAQRELEERQARGVGRSSPSTSAGRAAPPQTFGQRQTYGGSG